MFRRTVEPPFEREHFLEVRYQKVIFVSGLEEAWRPLVKVGAFTKWRYRYKNETSTSASGLNAKVVRRKSFADIRCTRADGSHAVGVRWSSWQTADAVVVVLGTVWDDLPRQALWGRNPYRARHLATRRACALDRSSRLHAFRDFTVSTAASSEAMSSGRPLTSCCGRCCCWCSATGMCQGQPPIEEETDATPDEGRPRCPQPSIQADASATMFFFSACSLIARCAASKPPGCPPRLGGVSARVAAASSGCAVSCGWMSSSNLTCRGRPVAGGAGGGAGAGAGAGFWCRCFEAL